MIKNTSGNAQINNVNNDLMKVFPVPGNIGVLLCTTWQLCCENNSMTLDI